MLSYKSSTPENGRSGVYKDRAIKELDLMHEAIVAGDYKKAMHHKIVANIAIDEMINVTGVTIKPEGVARENQ